MIANTSDWLFDTQDSNPYVRFIDRATLGDIDDALYDEHLRPIKKLSDKWWQGQMQKSKGSLPVPMVKYWGELMGMAGGNVRPPLTGLSQPEKEELARELRVLREPEPAVVGDTR